MNESLLTSDIQTINTYLDRLKEFITHNLSNIVIVSDEIESVICSTEEIVAIVLWPYDVVRTNKVIFSVSSENKFNSDELSEIFNQIPQIIEKIWLLIIFLKSILNEYNLSDIVKLEEFVERLLEVQKRLSTLNNTDTKWHWSAKLNRVFREVLANECIEIKSRKF